MKDKKRTPDVQGDVLDEKNAVINQLLLDVDALKARQDVIVDGLEYIADGVRTMFGISGIAPLIDSVVKKLR